MGTDHTRSSPGSALMTHNNSVRFMLRKLKHSSMKARAATRLPALLSLIALLLAAGCTSLLPADDDQISVGAYPLSPLRIEGPIHYQGTAANESEVAITMLTLNLTIEPESITSGTPAQDHAVNIAEMHVTYSDTRDRYTLKPGEYALSWPEGTGDTGVFRPGEVVELTLPLREPIPANTSVCADLWLPHHGTLTLSFQTPGVVELSGHLTAFDAGPLVP